jgi:hypothetical protein
MGKIVMYLAYSAFGVNLEFHLLAIMQSDLDGRVGTLVINIRLEGSVDVHWEAKSRGFT